MKQVKGGLLVITLLIAGAVLPSLGSNEFNDQPLGAVMDQSQDWSDDCLYISGFEWQEFIPTMKKHVRIEVKIAQWYTDSPNIKLTVEKPLGTILAFKEVPASVIPSGVCDWVSFDIPDIILTPGVNYFIRLTAPPGSEYGWGIAYNGLYPDGESSQSPADWCFRTYCLENNPPNKPSTNYNKGTDELILTATDPDDDNIRYGISWDDDYSVDQWTNFVSSGTQRTIYCEGRTDSVGVIVEDEYGAQSEWVMQKPKHKAVRMSLQQIFEMLLQNHQYTFPLIRLLFKSSAI